MPDPRDALRRIVGEPGVVTDPQRLQNFLRDERDLFRGDALAVLQPDTLEKLIAVVRFCAERRIAMVPQGGNTGYCGGATADSSGSQVVINLTRLNSLREIDSAGQTLTVDAGMVLHDVQAAAQSAGLLFPLSMGSEGSCQIGGNLATNAGGLAVLRYGTARDLVLGLEVVLPNGELFRDLQGLRKDNTGYDLKQLFIGAEGTLGIISGVQLRLFPRPTAVETAWVNLRSIRSAQLLLRFVQSRLGECVSSFEYISRVSLEYVLETCTDMGAPLETVTEHMALIELSAFEAADVLEDKFVEVLHEAQQRGYISEATLAQNETQRANLWRLRESIPRAEKLLGGSIKHDVSVRLSNIDDLIEAASVAVSAIAPQARLSVYGHVGDGNVHFNVLAPAGADPESFKAALGGGISAAVHGAATGLGGSFSAEHGVGQLKVAELAATKMPATLALMRQIKSAVDPHGLMNPGKLFE